VSPLGTFVTVSGPAPVARGWLPQVTGITASTRKIAALLIGVLVGWSVQLSYGRNGGHVTLDVRLSATTVPWPKLAHRPSGSPTACADRCHSNALTLTNSI
jgi:hypothetical protein